MRILILWWQASYFQVLSRAAEFTDTGQRGFDWLAALRDAQIGRTLIAVHREWSAAGKYSAGGWFCVDGNGVMNLLTIQVSGEFDPSVAAVRLPRDQVMGPRLGDERPSKKSSIAWRLPLTGHIGSGQGCL